MTSVDNRVVQMQFDNGQFQRGVADTNQSLDSLKDHLQLDGATNGLDGVQKTADGMDLGRVADGVDKIAGAFSALGVIGINVLSRLTQSALTFAGNAANAVLGPLLEGGKSRAIAIEQAKFQFRGLGLDIDSTMAVAKAAVLGTAYGLQDAATAAAQFGASGITAGNGLDAALRGISGVAAQTGSSYGDIANVFTKVAGQGRLMGDDLLSLSARGVNAAAILGKALGKSESDIREMVTDGKIDFATFSKVMNDTFGANASKASETFTGALANMKAALNRVGANIFTPLDEAERKVFVALAPAIDKIGAALTPVINMFGILANIASGQLVQFIEDFGNANFGKIAAAAPGIAKAMFNIDSAIKGIAGAIGKGFLEIFPGPTVQQVTDIANGIADLAHNLIPTAEQAKNISKIFGGFFAVIDIGFQIVSRLVGVIVDLLGFSTSGSGGILAFAGSIGQFLINADKAIKSGDGLNKFFDGLKNVLRVPIAFFKLLGETVSAAIEAFSFVAAGKNLDDFSKDVGDKFSGLIKVGEFFQTVWEGVKKVAEFVYNALQPLFDFISSAVKAIGTNVGNALSSLKFDQVLQLINTGLFAGMLALVSGFFGNLDEIVRGNRFAFLNPLKLVFSGLTTNLKALEINTNAKTLKEIAIAVALLAASAVALSLVDPTRLAAALTAMVVGIAGLMEALKVLVAQTKNLDSLKLIAVAATMNILAGSMLLVAGAIAILALIPIDRLIPAMGAFIVLLYSLVGAMLLLDKVGPKTIVAALAIQVLAGAMLVMVGAVAILAAIPFDNLAKGFITVVALMTAMVGVLTIVTKLGPKVIVASLAMSLLGKAILAMAGAVAILSLLKPEKLVTGLIGLAAVLGILVVAMRLMSDGPSLIGAAAMVIVAYAVVVLAAALKVLSTIKADQIGTTIGILAASLGILLAATIGFQFAALGAVAFLVVAAGLIVLATALKILATITWDEIGQGLGILAAAIGILAVGGLLLIPASVGFLLLGAAILLIGTGVYLAAAGVGLLAVGIAALVAVGAGGIALLVLGIKAFIEQFPAIGAGIGAAIVSMAVVVGENAPQLVQAFANLMLAMLAAIDQVLPAIINTATILIVSLVNALVVLIPLLVDAGLKILTGVLTGIANNIGGIVTAGANIIINLINGIANKIPDLLQAGANLIIKFINGLADTIRNNRDSLNRAILNLADAITGGLSTGLINGIGAVQRAVGKIVNAIPKQIRDLLGIHSPSRVTTQLGEFTGLGLAQGLDNSGSKVEDSASSMAGRAVSAVQKSISDISDAMDQNLDAQPTIQPVLDLSNLANGASQIQKTLGTASISVDSSVNNAQQANAGYESNMRATTDADGEFAGNSGDTWNFTQNNYSPKSLSPIELYRQTRSQLSVAKGESDK